MAISFLILPGCSKRPLLWNTLYKGDHEDYYKSNFLIAAADGDLEYIKGHLAEHPNPDNVRGEWGSTALSLATWKSHHEIIRLLLEAGANPDESVHGGSPLSIAITLGDTVAFDLLIKRSNLKLRSKEGFSPLHSACSYLNPSDDAVNHMVLALLRAGLDPNSQGPDGSLPLIRLTKNRREKAIVALLEHGADPRQTDQTGSSAISEAEKQLEVAKQSLAHTVQLLAEFDAGKKNIWSRDTLLGYISSEREKIDRSARILSSLQNARGALTTTSDQHPSRT